MKKWRIWMGVVVLFSSGLIIGFLAGNLTQKKLTEQKLYRPPDKRLEETMKKLTAWLDLTEEQQVEVRKIVSRSQDRILLLWDDHLPKIVRAWDDGAMQIRERLNPDQLRKYDEYLEKVRIGRAKRQARREARRKSYQLNKTGEE